MKSYTDIDQSKKLAEILPLESADMCYLSEESLVPKVIYYEMVFFNSKEERLTNIIHCWSLVALLSVLPKDIEGSRLRIDIDNFDFSIWYDDLKGYGVNDELPDVISKEPLDACVSMIEKLHELKML